MEQKHSRSAKSREHMPVFFVFLLLAIVLNAVYSIALLSRLVPKHRIYALHTAILSGKCLAATSPVCPTGKLPVLIPLSCKLYEQGVQRSNRISSVPNSSMQSIENELLVGKAERA